jgi:hypothetical protein
VGFTFAPATAYAYTWEDEYGDLPRYNFTINWPNVTSVYVHPWEGGSVGGPGIDTDGATPGRRGMFAWEWNPSETTWALVPHSNRGVKIAGLGLRATVAATTPSNGFGTQPWEADHLNGTSTMSTGVSRGTFTWEQAFGADFVTLGLGTVRSVSSPDRQYLPLRAETHQHVHAGRALDWRSGDTSLMALEVITQDRDLAEADTPALLPSQFLKYLRYYTLGMAFGRDGEGRKPILATHYLRRFDRGVAVLRRLADIAQRDRVWAREDFIPHGRTVPKVQLPADYPRVF